MKKILVIGSGFIPLLSFAQNSLNQQPIPSIGWQLNDISVAPVVTYLEVSKVSNRTTIKTTDVKFDGYTSGRSTTSNNLLLSVDASGNMGLVNGSQYLTVSDTSSPNATIMTVSVANNAISSMQGDINGKVPKTTTITINGTTQDLSANRTWSNIGIELPSQTGNSGKYLTTNGSAASWATITSTTNFSAPSAGNTFTSGTAFQPNASAASVISLQSTLSGLVGVTGTVAISMSPTSGGTYTTVSVQRLLISVSLVSADMDSGAIVVPAGYFVKVVLTGGITSSFTRWNVQ